MSNRLERRKTAKLKKVSELAKAIRNVEVTSGAEATKRAVKMYTVATATVLKEKLRYGTPKIRTTMNQILEVFEKIGSGELNIDEMEKALEDTIKMVEE